MVLAVRGLRARAVSRPGRPDRPKDQQSRSGFRGVV